MVTNLKTNTASTTDWIKATENMRIFAYEPTAVKSSASSGTTKPTRTPKTRSARKK